MIGTIGGSGVGFYCNSIFRWQIEEFEFYPAIGFAPIFGDVIGNRVRLAVADSGKAVDGNAAALEGVQHCFGTRLAKLAVALFAALTVGIACDFDAHIGAVDEHGHQRINGAACALGQISGTRGKGDFLHTGCRLDPQAAFVRRGQGGGGIKRFEIGHINLVGFAFAQFG